MAALLILLAAIVLLVWRDRWWRQKVAELRAQLAQGRRELQKVSGFAHDLKSPMQGVIGNTELMLAAVPGAAHVEELRDLQENAETAFLTRRWQDVAEIVTRAADACRAQLEANGVTVTIDTTERLPMVYVDGPKLEKALATLLGRPPTPRDGGVLVVAARRLRDVDDRLAIDVDDRRAREDDDRAWSGDIAACRRIVEAHGGTLAVERPAGGGWRFHLELPVWTT
jgi:K+-sensing histidine kinase KdpD